MEIIEGTVIIILHLILVFLVIYVNMTLYKNTKRERLGEKGKVVQDIMKHYAIVQCLSLPLLVFWYLVIIFDELFNKIPALMRKYWIYGFGFIYGMTKNYLGFTSLIVAIVRYTFLMHEANVQRIGVRRLKKIVIYASFVVPLVNSFLYESTQSIESWVMCLNNTKTGEQFWNAVGNQSYESPLYIAMHENLPVSLMQTLTIFMYIFLFISYSNIFEGFLYAGTMIYYRR